MTTQWTSTPPATPGLYFAARDRTPGFVRHWGGSAWSMPLDVRDVDWGQLHHTSFARDGVQERIEWVGRQLTYTNDGWILWGGQPCPLANRTLVVAECGNGNTHGGAASSVNWGDVVRFKVMSDGIEKPAPTTKASNPKDAIGSDKLPLHLWPETATVLGCLGLLDGALKYGRANFRAIGVRASIYKDAADRHLNKWFEGEEIDPDSGLPHLAHALATIAILVDAQAAGKLNDDRMVAGGYAKLVADMTPHVARLKALHADKSPKHYTIEDHL